MDEDSTVRENLMTRRGYIPFCGADRCLYTTARAKFDKAKGQFVCKCGWVSAFPEDFMRRYKMQWGFMPPELPLTIRITKVSLKDSWYINRIGEEFRVLKIGETVAGERMYITHIGRIINSYVLASDSVIVPEKEEVKS